MGKVTVTRQRDGCLGSGTGFTLIELITAVTISGFILTAALGTFRMATQIHRRGEARREATENCRGALDLISRDLTGAFLSSDQQLALFFGEDLSSDGLEIDSLRFTTLVNNPLRTGEATGDLAEVEYYIDADPGTPERWLVRRYNPYPRSGMRRGRTVLAGRNVVALEVLYFSSGEWVTTWQSRKQLPRAVYVMVSALIDPQRGTEESNQISLSNVVWLPYGHK